MGKFIDETGHTYGRLIVLYQNISMSKQKKRAYWHCKCDCGNECDINGSYLRNGSTKSCGCLQKENASKAASKSNRTNLIGQTFGRLTVIGDSGKRDNKGQIYWECQCECGNITNVVGPNLKHGNVKSCGCIHSYGEAKINKILTENNIPFQKEYSCKDCTISNEKPVRFDFFVNNTYVIEYDGIQHFKQVKGWEDFHKNIERDKIKNQYCKDNNIPIIRIPYTHLDQICLKDLLLETSQFII